MREYAENAVAELRWTESDGVLNVAKQMNCGQDGPPYQRCVASNPSFCSTAKVATGHQDPPTISTRVVRHIFAVLSKDNRF